MTYVRYFAQLCAWYVCRDEGTVCHMLRGPFKTEQAALKALDAEPPGEPSRKEPK